MRAVAAGVNDALRDALMVEMKDLLAEMKIFDQGRPARPDLDGVLVVRNRAALRGGKNGDIAVRDLMQFAALPAIELLVVYRRRTVLVPEDFDDLAMSDFRKMRCTNNSAPAAGARPSLK